MQTTRLTFDEYVDLRLRPPAGADRAFHKAAEMERERMFPMTTSTVRWGIGPPFRDSPRGERR